MQSRYIRAKTSNRKINCHRFGLLRGILADSMGLDKTYSVMVISKY
jgi:hypothetical protein